MRNLKRALSLALASVMLLGMMVIGTSAATFNDADEIVNTEAVAITAGLGLFAGSEGNFMPKGEVTRAQMATIIVKMLYGSQINADSFKGSGKFSDTAAFEGGWAEGYINLCANLGVVSGYGDGTFRPGQAVTTAEAITMIINALGVDAGAGTWPHTVMAKAEEMGLYGEMASKPATYDALIRDQLAVIVWEGLNYSEEGETGWMVNGKLYTDYLAAYLANGGANGNPENIKTAAEDTLANNVFGVKEMAGIVTDVQAAGAEYTEVYTGTYNKFGIEAGLDMIGHYVTVYYKEAWESEGKPGTTYAIVDETKTVVVEEDIDTFKDYKAAFGAKAVNMKTVNSNAAVNIFEDFQEDSVGAIPTYDAANSIAPAGTYVIYEGEIISYIAPSTVYASRVSAIGTTEGKETITLAGVQGKLENNETLDEVVEYDGIAKNDYVTYIKAGTQYVLTKMDSVKGLITKAGTNKDNDRVLTVDGKEYIVSGATNNTGLSVVLDNAINYNTTYELFLDPAGKVVFTKAEGSADVSNIVYILGAYTLEQESGYGQNNVYVYAQGVDTTGKEVSTVIGIDYSANGSTDLGVCAEQNFNANNYTLAEGYYTFKKASGKAGNEGVMIAEKLTAQSYTDDTPLYIATATGEALDADSLSIAGAGFLTAETKFIVVEGNLKEKLDVAVSTGTINYTLANGTEVLMSQNSAKQPIVEVVVINDTLANVVSTDYIYVSANDLAGAGVNAAGYLYDVYTSAGEKIQITTDVQDPFNSTEGFYTFSYDEAEKLYTINSKLTPNYIKYGEVFNTVYNNTLLTGNISANVEKAIIVDTRTEDQVEASEIDLFTTLDEVLDAKNSVEDGTSLTVTMDVYMDKDQKNVSIIFITGASIA